MYISSSLIAFLATASAVQALQLSDISRAASSLRRSARSLVARQSSCPAVWSTISSELTAQYLSNGQCTDAARSAIRGAFHDCFNGACDGSLILANECSNSENGGMQGYCDSLSAIATNHSVGVADLIQFAGGKLPPSLDHNMTCTAKLTTHIAHAIKTCPLGPTITVKVGRTDSSTAAPLGILPSGNASSSDLLASFASKGFSTTDLVALIGAHSTAKQFTSDPSKAGAALDSTPGVWDTKFYSETKAGTAPFTIPADKNLADDSQSSGAFTRFGQSQGAWAAAFVPAMEKMSMLGVTDADLIDCTSALPGGSTKRDVKRASLFDRLHW